jgi:hypothetical protein
MGSADFVVRRPVLGEGNRPSGGLDAEIRDLAAGATMEEIMPWTEDPPEYFVGDCQPTLGT